MASETNTDISDIDFKEPGPSATIGNTPNTLLLPWPAYDNFFKLLKLNEKGNFIVKCKLCINSELSVSKNSTYNMKLHIEVSSVLLIIITTYLGLFLLLRRLN